MEPLLRTEPHPIVAALRESAVVLREASDSVNLQGRLTEPVMNILADAGTFGCLFPAELGGPAMRLDEQVELVREVAYQDASIGWCVSILIDGGFFAGSIDSEVARDIYPYTGLPTATTTFPLGTTRPGPAGQIDVAGRWMFASGVQNSDFIVLGVTSRDSADEVLLDASGEPLVRWVWVPTKSVSVEGRWEALGLCGTGSVEISVDHELIDQRHIVDYSLTPQGALSLPPNSRYRAFLAAKGVGVPLGIARRAYDEYCSLLSGSAKLGPRESSTIARAEGMITAAESIVTNIYTDISDRVWADTPLSTQGEGRLNSTMPVIGDLCYRAVDIIMDAIGARSVLKHYVFERLFRDISTLRRHLVYQQSYHRVGGDLLLGIAQGGQWK